MSIHLLTVSHCGYSAGSRPRIFFRGSWLHEIGFIPGALVQVLPEPEGLVFNLFNENIKSYSDLFNSTKEKGGNLIHVCHTDDKQYKEPTFLSSGKYIYESGLSLGDRLIAKYDYGIIRVRKIDPCKLGCKNVRIITTSCISRKYSADPIPQVRISGDWLNEIGFTVNSIMAAAAEPDVMTLTLKDADAGECKAFMKYLRGNKMKIVQTRKDPKNRWENPRPCIGITGSLVERAEFKTGDMLAASYDYGAIKLQKLDFEKLGF